MVSIPLSSSVEDFVFVFGIDRGFLGYMARFFVLLAVLIEVLFLSSKPVFFISIISLIYHSIVLRFDCLIPFLFISKCSNSYQCSYMYFTL